MNEELRDQLHDICRRVLAGDATAEAALFQFVLDYPMSEEPMASLPVSAPVCISGLAAGFLSADAFAPGALTVEKGKGP